MKINIKPGILVAISKESRALLERAHREGIVKMYKSTLEDPQVDNLYSYFKYDDDCSVDECYSFVRYGEDVNLADAVTVEQLKEMLYPIKHNLVMSDAVKITPGSHAVVRELAKKYNISLFPDMEKDSFEDEMKFSKYYKFSGKQIFRNDVNINVLSLDEFALKMMGLYKPSYVNVKLNEQHMAVVSKNNIKVGCQTFSHSIIGELQKAIEQIAD
jgi:hypothetical protein